MALNYKEMGLLLRELPLSESFIQGVTEHDIHSFTLSLFSKSEKAWLLYVEVGTPFQRFSRTGIMRKKSAKMQRFTQYMRANLVGSKIIGARQKPNDREVIITMVRDGKEMRMRIRLFSGPGANVIITDSENRILELLMRRPKRGEGVGDILDEGKEKEPNDSFRVREHGDVPFNEFIDREFDKEKKDAKREDAKKAIERMMVEELGEISERIASLEKRELETRGYMRFKETGDLLSAYSYSVRKGERSATLFGFDGEEVTISLDPALSVSENINAYYRKYKREERIHASALNDLEEERWNLDERKAFYESALSGDRNGDKLLDAEAQKSNDKGNKKPFPFLRVDSHGFDIIVGRSAKENDEILRRYTRGSDLWLHTRDYKGAYVVIKSKKGKSVPLETLLDAAYLAIHYSKAKSEGKADLYYTECKYLRRAKDSKTGLVTVTQEKNLSVRVDEKRVKELLFKKEA